MTIDFLGLAVTPQLSFPGGQQAVLMLLRWVHFVAGIIWIGLLYFFNLVNAPFLNELDAKQRAIVIPRLMPKAMWWFRWTSVVTVLAGIAYWNIIVATDANNAIALGQSASAGRVIGSFFGIWTVAFAVEMGLLMSPPEILRKGAVFGVIMAIVIFAAGYVFLALNEESWMSNRALAIGIGGGMGWFMMLNVWGIVWRMQKKIIRWTSENTTKNAAMPAEAVKTARLSFLASRLNFWLSFPMLFFMGAASHYIMFGG
jgi:uncharacterized membrane protein